MEWIRPVTSAVQYHRIILTSLATKTSNQACSNLCRQSFKKERVSSSLSHMFTPIRSNRAILSFNTSTQPCTQIQHQLLVGKWNSAIRTVAFNFKIQIIILMKLLIAKFAEINSKCSTSINIMLLGSITLDGLEAEALDSVIKVCQL